MDLKEALEYLKRYDGPEVKLMEVCGTHTASIFRHGIRSLISEKIKLISGPGCPVCVTPTAYIDRVAEFALKEGYEVLTFGDMMKVPGSGGSLSERKGDGARVRIMYSPFEALELAEADPSTTYVVAAVGFETTVPSYALLAREARRRGIRNIRLVTALKTVMPALRWICDNQPDIAGFLCPGHVSVITGPEIYRPLAERYGKPCAVAGFEAEHLLAAICDLMRQIEAGKPRVDNLYPEAVRPGGNPRAMEAIEEVFEPGDAVWRGLGSIAGSGLYLRGGYEELDGGSRGLDGDMALPEGCRCADVITGRIDPSECPMFGSACTPASPYGPCMVSAEGACGIWYRNRGTIGKETK